MEATKFARAWRAHLRVADVARVLGISPQAVRSRAYRMRRDGGKLGRKKAGRPRKKA